MEERAQAFGAPRVAIYSQDGLGLGHMRRTTSIARGLLQMFPNGSVLTLSDSPAGQHFERAPHHDYLKLPSIVKVGPGTWQAPHLALPFSEVRAMREEVIRTAILSFRPHILLVDHMPHGAMGELLPALQALKASDIGAKVVLGLRDILDAPETIQRVWASEGAYEAIEKYYDLVLAYGMPEVFDLASQYCFTPALAQRLRYCGYVCAPDVPSDCNKVRTKFLSGPVGQAKSRLVVAMAGGGADAYPLMSTLLDAYSLLRPVESSVLVIVAGPFLPEKEFVDLKQRGRRLGVRVLRSTDDSLNLIAAADLAVAMAGYNTTVEILRWSARGLLVPRPGPSAEQRTRLGYLPRGNG